MSYRVRTGIRQPSLPSMTLAVVMLTAGFQALGAVEATTVDWTDPLAWLTGVQPETAFMAVSRTVGLAIGYWVIGTTAAYTLARRRGRIPRWIRLITLPTVRRVVDRAFATALTASIALSPIHPATAIEEEPAPIVFDVHDGVPLPHVLLGPGNMTPAVDSPIVQSMPAPIASRDEDASVATATVPFDNYTVVVGDSLWTIAARRLALDGQEEPAGGDITVYWRRIIDANRDSLRSGDPNLIYPGEIIAMPAVGADQ